MTDKGKAEAGAGTRQTSSSHPQPGELGGALPFSNGDERTAVIEREPADLIDFGKADALDLAVAEADKLVESFRRIRGISLRMTDVTDWSFQGDSLYLAESGAQKIAILWGLNVTPERIDLDWFEDDAGRYYVYTVTGTAFSRRLNRMVREIGTCSSRDDFFGKFKDDAGNVVWKQIEKIDITDVKRKAMTNFMGRAIKRCLGLSGITTDELRGAKIDPDKITRIAFGAGKKKAEAQLTEAARTMRAEIAKIAGVLSQGDSDAIPGYLREASYFKTADGTEKFVTSLDNLTSEGWIKATLGRIKGKLKEKDPTGYADLYPGEPNGHDRPRSASGASQAVRR
jgi:hypothetical protein